MTSHIEIARLARDALGIDQLRPGQAEAVLAAVRGQDLLAVMPTGYGKSAVYQLAGAAVAGATVVVSPLIALQRDQVDSLDRVHVGRAAAANSLTAASARDVAFRELRRGDLEFLFLAPEQLVRPATIDELRAIRPSLFVVDEAHCISSWGHDFRPDYLALGQVIEDLGHPTTIALTATAAPPVREEIIERLRLRDPRVVVHGFDRPNIDLAVTRFADEQSRDVALVDSAADLAADGTGIVYVGTRKRAELLAVALAERGVRSAAYHAGLSGRRRDETQRRFMDDQLQVVTATTAFGMGIDKAAVRFVLHGDLAESLDAYYQEIGRAGRDGDPATAALFHQPGDLSMRRFLGGGGRSKPDTLQRVFEAAVAAGTAGASLPELRGTTGFAIRTLTLAVSKLADAGAVSQVDDRISASHDAPPFDDVLASIHGSDEQRRAMQRSRLEMMRAYAEARTCRRRFLLSYFGEAYERDCGRCDNCRAGREPFGVPRDDDDPFDVGMHVRHEEFGRGEIIRAESDVLVVLFDRGGYRTLSKELTIEGGLLERDPAAR